MSAAQDEYVPQWKREMLAEKAERAARSAKPQPCPACAAATLVGRGDDCTTATARVDAQPLPDERRTLEVIVAVLSGRGVFVRQHGALDALDRMQLGIGPGQLPPREPIGPRLPLHVSHICSPGDPSDPTGRTT